MQNEKDDQGVHGSEASAKAEASRHVAAPEYVPEDQRTVCVDSPTDQHGYECVLCGHRPIPIAWQPIATAPKDGRVRVLLYQPEGQWNSRREHRREWIDIGYWHQPANPEVAGFWCCMATCIYRPTHWMPLPEPPR